MKKILPCINKLLIMLLSLFFSVLLLEFFLIIGAKFQIFPDYKASMENIPLAYDNVFLYSLKPNAQSDIDANGFRNNLASEKVNAIVIGDSQTYGFNAFTHESWPKQLSKKLNLFIYNFGMGGWGPIQYYAILDKAFQMNPKIILVGFYLGNDMDDVCYALRVSSYWQNFAKNNKLDTRYCPAFSNTFNLEKNRKLTWKIVDYFRHTNIAAFLKQIKPIRDFFSYRRDLKLAINNPESYLIINEPEIHTIVYLGQNKLNSADSQKLDTEINLTKFFYKKIADKAKGKRLIIIFIPSKEHILYDFLISKNRKLSDQYHTPMFVEKKLIKEFSAYFNKLGVENLDITPFLTAQIKSGGPYMFFNYLERHPTAIGYQTIAEVVFEKFFKNK